MVVICDVISKIFSATMHTAHRLPNLVTGAQVEDKILLVLVALVAELTRELKQKTRELAQHLHRETGTAQTKTCGGRR